MLTEHLLYILNNLLPDKVFTNEQILQAHGGNQFYIQSKLPEAVCYAESEEDVLVITGFCVKYKIPLIPYGGGTSVEGHTVPVEGGICLNLSKMDKVLELNLADGYVVVQPGIAYNKLNEYLAPYGVHFPVEAGWGASIGGMLSTNASGAGAVDAGSMAKNVLACDVVTYKEERALKINLGTLAQKSSAGYNLLSLLIGAEGTLGVVTKICLKIRKDFLCHKTICCQFEAIQAAVEFIIAVKGKVNFRRAELLDKLQTEACLKYSDLNSLLYQNKNTIIIELAGNDAVIKAEIKILLEALNKYKVEHIKIFEDKKSAEVIWMMRKNACPAAIQLINKNKKAMATDVCVPLSKLNECIQSCYDHMNKLGLKSPLVAHIGDGNFHFTLLINSEDQFEIEKAKEFGKCVVEEALKVGGTCTGEHGIGIGKKEHLHNEHANSIFLMEAIKLSFDPLKLFNPGKVFSFTKTKSIVM